MQDITKLCADHLRAFSENYGIKLKASHAHELVAAFLGYKSRAALLADTKYSPNNLPQANIIVLTPTALIEQRRKDLKDLPPELPDPYSLGEVVYTVLLAEKLLINTPWPTFDHLAKFLADEYLRQNQMEKTYRAPVREGVKVEDVENGVYLTVHRFYQVLPEKLYIDGVLETNITTTILLQRIAAHIGFVKPEVSVRIDHLN